MPEFYTIFAPKNSFCPNLGEGATAPLPLVSYAYALTYATTPSTFTARRTAYKCDAHSLRLKTAKHSSNFLPSVASPF